jgi:hypothetical protein
MMKYLPWFTMTILFVTALFVTATCHAFEFEAPVRFTTDEGPVRVERPGYACPCWTDIDGDGDKDLLVGQFHGGKIRVYKNVGKKNLAAGEWLQAGDAVAEVPGVW